MIDEVNIEYLRAPFPYFGGKSMIADFVWRRHDGERVRDKGFRQGD